MCSRIKVLVPLKREKSPYLKLLYTHVEKYGIEVLHSKSLWSFNFIRKCGSAKIIHLHWIEYLIRHKCFLLSLTKFILSILILLLLRAGGKRLIITLHNIRPHERICPKMENSWFEIMLTIADKIIVHNNYSYSMVKKIYGTTVAGKTHIIPHGNFIGCYPNRITQSEARKILGIPRDTFVVLFFGAIREYKGIDDLLSVFSDLLSEREDIFLLVCGRTENERLRENLLSFCKKFEGKCIVRLEYIPDNEVLIYMNAADIGVLPYKEVTTSGAALLFQSFAKTVIVPDLPPLKETLGENSVYFKWGDKEEMKKSIIDALCLGRERMRLLGRKALKKALELDWNNIAFLTFKLYYSMVNSYKHLKANNNVKLSET